MFKTHASVGKLPAVAAWRPDGGAFSEAARILVCTRNPKDTCVSLYHHGRAIPSESHERHRTSGWAAFLQDFLDGRVAEADAGDWFEWTLGWWRASLDFPGQILVVHYEAMLREPAAHVRRVARFLGVALSDRDVGRVVERSSFAKMKKAHEDHMADYEAKTGSVTRRPGESAHFRRGVAGGWRDLFSQEDAAKLDHLYALKMAGSGLAHDFG